jgi:hypothetical protein
MQHGFEVRKNVETELHQPFCFNILDQEVGGCGDFLDDLPV